MLIIKRLWWLTWSQDTYTPQFEDANIPLDYNNLSSPIFLHSPKIPVGGETASELEHTRCITHTEENQPMENSLPGRSASQRLCRITTRTRVFTDIFNPFFSGNSPNMQEIWHHCAISGEAKHHSDSDEMFWEIGPLIHQRLYPSHTSLFTEQIDTQRMRSPLLFTLLWLA